MGNSVFKIALVFIETFLQESYQILQDVIGILPITALCWTNLGQMIITKFLAD